MAKKHAAEWLFGEDEPSVVEISRAKGKAVVLLSDERRIRASAAALAIAGIERGSVLDVSARRRLVEAEGVAAAAKKGVKMLAASAKSAAELRERMVAKGIEEDVAVRAIEHLRSHGLIDEAAMAKRILEQPAMSEAMARHTMESRGLTPEVIEAAMSRRAGSTLEEAARYLNRAVPKSLPPDTRRRRLVTALARRGYDEEESAEVVRRLIPGAREE